MAETPLAFEIITFVVLALFFIVDLFVIGRDALCHPTNPEDACSISPSSWLWR